MFINNLLDYTNTRDEKNSNSILDYTQYVLSEGYAGVKPRYIKYNEIANL